MRLTPRQEAAKQRYFQRKYAKDLIQPCDNKFKLYYPKQWKEMEEAQKQQEVKAQELKENRDQYFKKYKNSQYRHMMKNALKLEEQLDGQK